MGPNGSYHASHYHQSMYQNSPYPPIYERSHSMRLVLVWIGFRWQLMLVLQISLLFVLLLLIILIKNNNHCYFSVVNMERKAIPVALV